MEQENPIFKFLNENKLTDLDEKSFLDKYSNPEKAKEIHSFMAQNKLTNLDENQFFDKYLKKKEPASSAVTNLLKPLPQSGEQPKAGFPTSPSEAMKVSAQLESTKKQKEKTNLDYLKDINNTYKERIATSQERVNAKRELTQLQPQIEGAYSQLQQLQNAYQDPSVPIDQKKQAFNSYNTLLTQIEPIRSRYDELSSKYNDLVKQDKQQVAKLKDLDNQRQLHLKGEFSIGKDLIEKNNGSIWAESVLGKGSKFYISLKKMAENS